MEPNDREKLDGYLTYYALLKDVLREGHFLFCEQRVKEANAVLEAIGVILGPPRPL